MRKRKYTALAERSHTCNEGTDYPVARIHNIVSTAMIESTRKQLDLDRICEMLPGSSYDRRKFAAMTIRLANPNCTILLFASGKLVVTGGRTWYESVLSCLFLRIFLQRIMVGEHFAVLSCDIQNIVAHVEVLTEPDTFLDIDAMYVAMNMQCTYQKQMFPGLIYRPPASPVVLLCFYSGKIVITGGKSPKDVHDGWNRLWPTVKVFIKHK